MAWCLIRRTCTVCANYEMGHVASCVGHGRLGERKWYCRFGTKHNLSFWSLSEHLLSDVITLASCTEQQACPCSDVCRDTLRNLTPLFLFLSAHSMVFITPRNSNTCLVYSCNCLIGLLAECDFVVCLLLDLLDTTWLVSAFYRARVLHYISFMAHWMQ